MTTTFTRTGTTRLTATRGWDANRLKSVTNTWNTGARSLDTTLFDAMNRRKTVEWQDGSSWGYDYNDRGEVIAGSRKWSDAASVSGQQYAYSFDTIGNRTGTVVNGRAASYGADAGNRLTSRDVPGAVDVLGTASPLATVTVNGNATARHGDYFYKELAVTNSAGPAEALPTITATANSGTTTRTGRVFVPKTPEVFAYDFDGNLTGDGRFTYTWDAENRLTGIATLASVPAASRVKLAFAYDARHRRIRKQVWRWQSGAWVLHHTIRFAYDGWNLVAELGDAGQPLRTYTWGKDLSGTLQGAGGVGGLLLVQDATEGKMFSAAYDLNGNIVALVDQATGAAAAQYEYGPFGELIRKSGQYAQVNPFRFSTKCTDDETGLLYYGYRYYNPSTGRWLGRDPAQESGGLGLYAFLYKSPHDYIDVLGREPVPTNSTGLRNSDPRSPLHNYEPKDDEAINYSNQRPPVGMGGETHPVTNLAHVLKVCNEVAQCTRYEWVPGAPSFNASVFLGGGVLFHEQWHVQDGSVVFREAKSLKPPYLGPCYCPVKARFAGDF